MAHSSGWETTLAGRQPEEHAEGNRSRKLELVHDAEPVRLGELINDAARVAIERIVREELETKLEAAPYERVEVRHGYRKGTRQRTLAELTGPLALTVPRAEDAALVLLFSLIASGQIKLRKLDGLEKIAPMLNAATREANNKAA